MTDIILIAHNLRSSHNVGSLLRTAEGLGINQVILSGYSPYPISDNDTRLPHIALKIDKQIAKTALGAEKMVNWRHLEDINLLLVELSDQGYRIVGLEQTEHSIELNNYQSPDKIALIIGREVEGLELEIINQCDQLVEIPMLGRKESFNVVQAAAMALYQIRYGR